MGRELIELQIRQQIEQDIATIFEETGLAKIARENNFSKILQDTMLQLEQYVESNYCIKMVAC